MTITPARQPADRDEVRAAVAARYGGLARADILADDDLTAAQRLQGGGQVGCIAGAPSFAEYRDGLTRAGFTGISIAATHQVRDGVHAAVIRAARP